jgi:hypothetical protein
MSDKKERRWYKNPIIMLPIIVAIVVPISVVFVAHWLAPPPSSDFSLSVKPMIGEVSASGVIQTTITVKGLHGYDHTVSLSASGQPTGIVISFAPPFGEAKPSYTSGVTIKVDADVPEGKYETKIKGMGADGKEHNCNYILTVNPMPFTPTPTQVPTATPTPTAYKVLFDETKLHERSEGGYYNQISETAWYGGWNFSKLLEDNGFSVSSLSIQPITYEKLKKYNVLIMFSTSRYYSEDEIDAIETFVEEGGGLFLVRDRWGGKEEDLTNQIAKRFRVSFAKDGQICDPTNYYCISRKNVIEIFDIKQHAITEGIYSFYLVDGTYIIRPGSSTVLAYADNDAWFDILRYEPEYDTYGNEEKDANEITGPFPVLSVMDYGEGRVVFMGDSSLFLNTWLYHLDDMDLGLNIVKWLVKLL